MFVRRDRGFLDLCVALLLLWAAAYHTPVGALARYAAAQIVGAHVQGRPLLAYYSDGLYDAQVATEIIPPVAVGPGLTPTEALGQGLFVAWSQLPDADRVAGRALAHAHQVPAAKLDSLAGGPLALAHLCQRTSAELSAPEDAGVLALFVGQDAAEFAVSRARDERGSLTLESLVRQLPPRQVSAALPASRALMLGTAYGLAWPVADSAPMTSPFGYRLHPTLGVRKLHAGVDLSVPPGTPVHSVGAGVVRRSSEDGINGRIVVVDHGHGVTSAYCHNSELLVAVGERVAGGQRIALSGSTGRSTGPHVHYQLQLHDQPVDPLLFHGHRTRTVGGGVDD